MWKETMRIEVGKNPYLWPLEGYQGLALIGRFHGHQITEDNSLVESKFVFLLGLGFVIEDEDRSQ